MTGREAAVKGGSRKSAFDVVLGRQRYENRTTADHAERFANHRSHVMSAILDRTALPDPNLARRRLCLLGAGNCNDVDLNLLLANYDEVHLVDLDREALERAAATVPSEVRHRLRRHAQVDLTGLLSVAHRWQRYAPSAEEIKEERRRATTAVVSRLPGPFEVVVSCCVLSQMWLSLVRLWGRDKLRLPEYRDCLLGIHLASIAALTSPGGRCLLFADVAQADENLLQDLPGGQAPRALLADLVEMGRGFYGTNPFLIARALRSDATCASAIEASESIEPWLWRISAQLTVMVTGFSFRRRRRAVAGWIHSHEEA